MKKSLIVFSAVATVVLAVFIYFSLSYDEMDATRKSAENGDISAQLRMASAYLLGKGVPQSDKEAVKWYRKAAEQGNERAQALVGSAYGKGTGVAQDYEEAVKWYIKAADQGDPSGQFFLGRAYFEGKGVEKNYEEAFFWLNLAANQNVQGACIEMRDQASNELTPDQKKAGRIRCKNWLEDFEKSNL
jgi:hypothetical protein